MSDSEKLKAKTKEFVLKDFDHNFGQPGAEVKPDDNFQKLRDAGTRLWLDTGDIEQAEKLWCSQFEALTTNNTLLNKEVQKGIYDDLIKESAEMIRQEAPNINDKDLVLEIGFILNAKHALKLVRKFDAHVSVELHTDLGNDVERTIEYARRFYEICPERFYIKIPLTASGYLSARKVSAMGIPVNFTLGFSARQNYLACRLTNPKYVNVFMGRLNSFIADNGLGTGDNFGEKTTLSTQRWVKKLRMSNNTDSMLIGASMRTGEQAISLAGVDVYTMPTKVAEQFRQQKHESISSQVEHDPQIELKEGVKAEDINASSLWDVSEAFMSMVEKLIESDVDSMTASDLQAKLDSLKAGDLLPRWSDQDIQTAAADGKIPVYKRWQQSLKGGEIGLDSLMNLHAFYTFARDQQKLDDRIKTVSSS